MKNYLLLPIYFDNSSTTAVDPRIIEKILPYFYYKFGNYSSKNHIFGWQSEYVIENSRKKISKILNCNSRELIFTSCSTESNNISIKGLTYFYKNKGNHIIAFKIDHKSITEIYKNLFLDGFDVTFLNVKQNGLIDFNLFYKYIKNNTILVSLLYINNEIGVLQDVKKISKICKINNIFLFIDGSQCINKLYLNIKSLNIDILSLSSHKSYGPKGISLLYIRRKSNLFLKPLIFGGGHENNIRSGTLSTHLIVGLGEVYYLLKKDLIFINLKLKNFKNILFYELLKIDSIYLNGDLKYRVPCNLNINIFFINNESLIISLKNFAFSTSSSCSSNFNFFSIINFFNNKNFISSTLRLTFSKFNKLNDIFFFLNKLLKVVLKFRVISHNFLI